MDSPRIELRCHRSIVDCDAGSSCEPGEIEDPVQVGLVEHGLAELAGLILGFRPRDVGGHPERKATRRPDVQQAERYRRADFRHAPAGQLARREFSRAGPLEAVLDDCLGDARCQIFGDVKQLECIGRAWKRVFPNPMPSGVVRWAIGVTRR